MPFLHNPSTPSSISAPSFRTSPQLVVGERLTLSIMHRGFSSATSFCGPGHLENRAPFTLWTVTVVPKFQHLFSIALSHLCTRRPLLSLSVPPTTVHQLCCLSLLFFSVLISITCSWRPNLAPCACLAGALLLTQSQPSFTQAGWAAFGRKRLGAIGILKFLKTRHFTDFVVFNQEKNIFIQIRCIEDYLRALAM